LTKSDLQQLAEERIADAGTLLLHGRFGGAYYLAGLAVECALKACIAKNVNQNDFPDLNRVKKSYSHNLEQLAETAGIQAKLDFETTRSTVFARNWNIVRLWQVESRYMPTIDSKTANEMYAGVTEATDGVLPWLRTLW
jgi:AbiV family abortive infection protein